MSTAITSCFIDLAAAGSHTPASANTVQELKKYDIPQDFDKNLIDGSLRMFTISHTADVLTDLILHANIKDIVSVQIFDSQHCVLSSVTSGFVANFNHLNNYESSDQLVSLKSLCPIELPNEIRILVVKLNNPDAVVEAHGYYTLLSKMSRISRISRSKHVKSTLFPCRRIWHREYSGSVSNYDDISFDIRMSNIPLEYKALVKEIIITMADNDQDSFLHTSLMFEQTYRFWEIGRKYTNNTFPYLVYKKRPLTTNYHLLPFQYDSTGIDRLSIDSLTNVTLQISLKKPLTNVNVYQTTLHIFIVVDCVPLPSPSSPSHAIIDSL